MNLRDKIYYIHSGNYSYMSKFISDKNMNILKLLYGSSWSWGKDKPIIGREANKGILYYELLYKLIKDYEAGR